MRGHSFISFARDLRKLYLNVYHSDKIYSCCCKILISFGKIESFQFVLCVLLECVCV